MFHDPGKLVFQKKITDALREFKRPEDTGNIRPIFPRDFGKSPDAAYAS